MHACIVKTLSKLPHEIIDWTLENLFFFSDNGYGQYIPLNDMKGWKAIILLNEKLLDTPKEQQTFTITHEIAHAKLNHHFLSTPKENQEGKADKLAKKWLDRG